ncbi:hypothetical protein ACHQM5_004327 [Ranunculus cassubicifolius]
MADDARVAATAELEVGQTRHATAVAEVKFVKEELEKLQSIRQAEEKLEKFKLQVQINKYSRDLMIPPSVILRSSLKIHCI